MILDYLKLCQRYAGLSPRFEAAFGFLQQLDPDAPTGRVDLDGDNVFALIQNYTTRPVEEGDFEAHRQYIDVQYVHSGRETIMWAPLSSLTEITAPYQDDFDAILYKQVDLATPLRLSSGMFAIFFPEDAHIPCCVWDEPTQIYKVVVKVHV